MDVDQVQQHRIDSLFPHLNERQRRLVAAAEARAIGYGGVSRLEVEATAIGHGLGR